MKRFWQFLISLLILSSPVIRATGADGFQKMDFTVDGAARTALVYIPAAAKTNSTPVVFVFHGHGGSVRQVARSFHIENEWPEAIVVYMQGLATSGLLTDPAGKLPGWQAALGGQGDRDLKFFDDVLVRLKQDFTVDAKRIYATGHSNGGGFTYLLWRTRGNVFAAVAPSAAAAVFAKELSPKPAMILGGENDPLVKFAWQKRTMDTVRAINGCAPASEPWAKQCQMYSSTNATPLVTFIYPGGHEFNPAAPALIVKFFKEHPAIATK